MPMIFSCFLIFAFYFLKRVRVTILSNQQGCAIFFFWPMIVGRVCELHSFLVLLHLIALYCVICLRVSQNLIKQDENFITLCSQIIPFISLSQAKNKNHQILTQRTSIDRVKVSSQCQCLGGVNLFCQIQFSFSHPFFHLFFPFQSLHVRLFILQSLVLDIHPPSYFHHLYWLVQMWAHDKSYCHCRQWRKYKGINK